MYKLFSNDLPVLKINSLIFKLLIVLGFVAYVIGVALLLRIAERFYLRLTSRGNKTKMLQPGP